MPNMMSQLLDPYNPTGRPTSHSGSAWSPPNEGQPLEGDRQPLDPVTGGPLAPGSPSWRPIHQHILDVFNSNYDQNRYPVYDDNSQTDEWGLRVPNHYNEITPPWYRDPALLGAMSISALPLLPGFLGFTGFGGGSAAAGGTSGLSGATSGVASGLPGSMSTLPYAGIPDVASQFSITSTPLVTGGMAPNTLAGAMSGASSHMAGSNIANRLANAGSILGRFGSNEQANRALEGNFSQNYDRLMLEAQQERDRSENNAMRGLAQTGYILGGGANYSPPTIQLGGRSVTAPTFSFAPRPSSDAQRQGASTLQEQLLRRLQPGGSYTPQPLGSYARPGMSENIARYGSAALGGLGTLADIFGWFK